VATRRDATRRDADEINVKRYQPPTAAPC